MNNIINFVYGLGFFTLGIVAWTNKAHTAKEDPIIKSRPWLILFALIHAAAEWADTSIFKILGDWVVPAALNFHSVSFVFLGIFGFALIGKPKKLSFVYFIPPVVFVFWEFFSYQPSLRANDFRNAEIVSRVLLGLPSSTLCAVAFLVRSKYLAPTTPKKIVHGFYFLSATFAAYAVFTGIFFDAQFVSLYFGIRLEIIRTFCAIGIAILYNTINQYIEWEAEKSCRLAKQKAGCAEERRRVADELHDTVIQDLFALRLDIDNSFRSFPNEDPRILIRRTNDSLNKIINKIRIFLETSAAEIRDTADLFQQLKQALLDAQSRFDIQTSLIINEADVEKAQLSPRELFLLLRILEEAIRNAAKHAPGSFLEVALHVQPHGLVFRVECSDRFQLKLRNRLPQVDGVGYGLTSIKHRAEELGAEVHLEITGKKHVFTTFIPWRATASNT